MNLQNIRWLIRLNNNYNNTGQRGVDPLMSIYSGFATRNQQQTYDECVETVLYIFQKRLLKFYRGEMADQQKFIGVLNKLFTQMKSMQTHKYLQPKSSNTFQQLLLFLKKKQLHDASVQANKISQIEKLDSTQLNLKHPIVKTPHPLTVPLRDPHNNLSDSRQHSTRLVINQSNNRHGLGHSDNQHRPNTTNNIRKRTTSRGVMNVMHNNKIEGKSQKLNAEDNCEQQAKHPNYQNNLFEIKGQLQNILNPSASKLVRISRNQPRTYLNNSQGAIKIKKRSTIKSKQKNTQENMEDKQLQKSRSRDSDVRDMIKGYINKTKKSYLRGFNKKKEQIDEMLKFI